MTFRHASSERRSGNRASRSQSRTNPVRVDERRKWNASSCCTVSNSMTGTSITVASRTAGGCPRRRRRWNWGGRRVGLRCCTPNVVAIECIDPHRLKHSEIEVDLYEPADEPYSIIEDNVYSNIGAWTGLDGGGIYAQGTRVVEIAARWSTHVRADSLGGSRNREERG